METRLKVIEKAVLLEDAVSQILSLLLDIQKESSLSFGYKNFALSFNAKINLLTDLKFIPKEISSDFQLFAEIRNKFAHVLYVDSFERCFEILNDKKKKFLEFYGDPNENLDIETVYNVCFDILNFQLGIWLRVTIKMLSEKKSQDLNKVGAIEMMRSFLNIYDDQKHNQLDSFLSTLKPVIDKIIPDEDFMKTYSELLSSQNRTLITTAYAAFNSRDIDTALTTMRPDVRWPKAFEGDFVTGHDQIREYWTRQWSEINPKVDPVNITELPDGRLEVNVHQVVKAVDGTPLFDGMVKHIYTITNGLIQVMEIGS